MTPPVRNDNNVIIPVAQPVAKKTVDDVPTWQTSVTVGCIGAVAYAFARINPLKSFTLLSLNATALINLRSFSEKLGKDKVSAGAIRIGLIVIVQTFFKKAYSSVNMFTSKSGNLFFYGVTATFIGMNALEMYQESKKKSGPSKWSAPIEANDMPKGSSQYNVKIVVPGAVSTSSSVAEEDESFIKI